MAAIGFLAQGGILSYFVAAIAAVITFRMRRRAARAGQGARRGRQTDSGGMKDQPVVARRWLFCAYISASAFCIMSLMESCTAGLNSTTPML